MIDAKKKRILFTLENNIRLKKKSFLLRNLLVLNRKLFISIYLQIYYFYCNILYIVSNFYHKMNIFFYGGLKMKKRMILSSITTLLITSMVMTGTSKNVYALTDFQKNFIDSIKEVCF